MNTTGRAFVFLVVLSLLCAGCGGGSGGDVAPPPPESGPWDFPASSRFAVSLLADRASYAAGDSIHVGVVFYNLPDVFGAAFAVNYPPAQLDAREVVENPAFLVRDATRGDNYLSVIRIDDDNPADPDTVSYGFSYLRGSGDAFTGSGVLVRIGFLAAGAGTAVLSIDPATFDLRKADGTRIDNFAAMARESLEISIR